MCFSWLGLLSLKILGDEAGEGWADTIGVEGVEEEGEESTEEGADVDALDCVVSCDFGTYAFFFCF